MVSHLTTCIHHAAQPGSDFRDTAYTSELEPPSFWWIDKVEFKQKVLIKTSVRRKITTIWAQPVEDGTSEGRHSRVTAKVPRSHVHELKRTHQLFLALWENKPLV